MREGVEQHTEAGCDEARTGNDQRPGRERQAVMPAQQPGYEAGDDARRGDEEDGAAEHGGWFSQSLHSS